LIVDEYLKAAIAEAQSGSKEGGIPHVVIGENKTFMGEEKLLQERGVKLEVLQDETCILLMRDFIRNNPQIWNEDIGQ